MAPDTKVAPAHATKGLVFTAAALLAPLALAPRAYSATCADADTPATQLSQTAAEQAVLCLINEERAKPPHNLPALTVNSSLKNAARQHAQDAARIKWWDGGGEKIHTNPETGSTPQSRIKDAGYCPAEADPPRNENGYEGWYQGGIEFQGGTKPQAAVTFWMNSDGHRRTLLDRAYRESGVAVVLGVAVKNTLDANGNPVEPDGGAIFVQTFGGCAQPQPPVGQPGGGQTTRPADLAALWNDGGSVSIAVYPSDGTKFLPHSQWSVRDGGWDDSVKWAAGDFTGDGKTDMVAAWNNNGSATLTMRASTGSGFNVGHWLEHAGGWVETSFYLPGDFDGDALTDLAVAWNDSNNTSVSVYKTDGAKFLSPAPWSVRDGGWDDSVKWAAGDFTGDGKTDMVAAWNNNGSATLTMRASTGSGFNVGHWLEHAGGWVETSFYLPGDFDGDGLTDLAVAWNDSNNTSVSVYKSDGAKFLSPAPWSVRDGGWDDSVKWTAADFNGDGRTDIASIWNNGGTNTLTVRQPTGSAFTPVHWATNAGGWVDSTAWCAGRFR